MQPSNNCDPATLTPRMCAFISQKPNNVTEAWTKGLAFGFRDCELWHGLTLKSLSIPHTDTFRHPREKDSFIRMSRQSSDQAKIDKKILKATYRREFLKVRRIDNLSPEKVIRNFMAYDTFVHVAAQVIPRNRTITECILGPIGSKQKNWPDNHIEIRDTLCWLAQKMMASEQNDNLFLLLAMWVELSNATAIQRLGCSSLRGKAYFDWSEVFAYVRNLEQLAAADSEKHTTSSSSVTSSSSESTTSSETVSDSAEDDIQSATTQQLDTLATLAAYAKPIYEPGASIELPVIALRTAGNSASASVEASAKTSAKTSVKASVKKVAPHKTKSGRICKPKSVLEIEFPTDKRRKLTKKTTTKKVVGYLSGLTG